ncbi:MAG TPA: DUF2341 domain-containing protein [Spirochaetota bacterium]|nr:DUF2341 domain-containing protein [Spirochaetota bacterium]
MRIFKPILILLISSISVLYSGWYASGWQKRLPLTINSAYIAGDFSVFNCYLNIKSNQYLSNYALADGADIRFTAADGVSELYYQPVHYTNGNLTAWIQLTDLSNSTNTLIYLYFHNSNAAAYNMPVNIWDNGYLGIWHLDNNAASATNFDNTDLSNHLITNTTFPSASFTNGCLDQASVFGFANGYYRIPLTTNFSAISNFTFSCWVFPTNLTGSGYILSSFSGGETNFYWQLTNNYSNMVFYFKNCSNSVNNFSTAAITPQAWNHLAVTYDAVTTNVTYYINGSLDTNFILTTNFNYTLTALSNRLGSGPDNNIFPGIIDELRIYNTPVDLPAMQTVYTNQILQENFFSTGGLEEKPDLPLTPTDLKIEKITFNAVTLSWTDQATNESAYYIYYRTNTSNSFSVLNIAADSSSYRLNNLKKDTLYYLRVRASNVSGASLSYLSTNIYTAATVLNFVSNIDQNLGSTNIKYIIEHPFTVSNDRIVIFPGTYTPQTINVSDSHLKISGIAAHQNQLPVIKFTDDSGFILNNVTDITIEKLKFTNSTNVIVISNQAHNNTLFNNIFTRNINAVSLSKSSGCSVYQNNFQYNNTAVYNCVSSNCFIYYNNFISNATNIINMSNNSSYCSNYFNTRVFTNFKNYYLTTNQQVPYLLHHLNIFSTNIIFPSTISSLNLQTNYKGVTLGWNKSTAIDYYNIYKNRTNNYLLFNSPYTNVYTTNFLDDRGEIGATYFYYVTAVRREGTNFFESFYNNFSATVMPDYTFNFDNVQTNARQHIKAVNDTNAVSNIASILDENDGADIVNYLYNKTASGDAVTVTSLPYEDVLIFFNRRHQGEDIDEINIYNRQGVLVYTILGKEITFPVATWRKRDSHGRRVKEGLYYIIINYHNSDNQAKVLPVVIKE